MRETRIIMGMPITVELVDSHAMIGDLDSIFSYFIQVDEQFSTYKSTSEIMRINRGELSPQEYSAQMREIITLAQKTKEETNGYFDITKPDGTLDPSGIVKGWAIENAAELLRKAGYKNFFIDAGGDIQSEGVSSEGLPWSVGIRNPFNQGEIVKVIYPKGMGVATSGSYIRGNHIYNPHAPEKPIAGVVSLTVIGPNVCEADRFATAAFAMGKEGVYFIEKLSGFEAYSIDQGGVATETSGFEAYLR
jgi:thiamine biosynthesis lipoprotein